MTTFSLFIGVLILTSNLKAQFNCNFNLDFSNGDEDVHIFIDTISNPSNIWQIGVPQKNIFNNLPGENAIVTDTLNSYGIDDTSSFIVKHVACEGFGELGGSCSISGMYQVDSDSLNDYGKIEFSPDNGLSWVLISDDSLSYNSDTWPIDVYNCNFTGSTIGQELFSIDLELSNEIFNISIGDTVLFKFTFVSDSVLESRDGLMFDDIYVNDMWPWGIHESPKNSLILFPNPSSSEVNFVNLNEGIQSIRIISADGTIVHLQGATSAKTLNIDFLNPGIYQIFVETTDGRILVGRVIKI